jgi:predicted O-methyltransferase YrrM
MDIVLSPFTLLFAFIFHYFRSKSLESFPISKKIFLKIGIWPIIDHYYEPMFDAKHLRYSLREERALPGIEFNDAEQLNVLEKFNFSDELLKFPIERTNNALEFYYNNGTFEAGDAEYLYNMIRLFKPKRIIEVGCGNSTLIVRNAIKKNMSESIDYNCEHICIEPYEIPWLEEIGIKVIRDKVENVGLDIFKTLTENDILFIDSSHIIRPQGDVLFEYLELLPSLNKGVIIHIHDIFTPRDYRDEWLGEHFWNEQYLLEAFLTHNKNISIIGATNYLSHKYKELFSSKCPIYKAQSGCEPGSFYMIKTSD